MTDITLRSDVDVEWIDMMPNTPGAGDGRICAAARTSTAGAGATPAATQGLLRSLMANRHGSPFEHVVFTWRVTAPIFVWREHMRHRMASYNEESGRYKQLDPVFYVPRRERRITQVGKAMAYDMQPGTDDQHRAATGRMSNSYRQAYEAYEAMLESGIAREVARDVLPVAIYSTAYVTMNLRALFNFLSLRVESGRSAYPSRPLDEIAQIAAVYERDAQAIAPIAMRLFDELGRVAP